MTQPPTERHSTSAPAIGDEGTPHGRPRLVLIDGPSGSGKSTFADVVRASWEAADRESAGARAEAGAGAGAGCGHRDRRDHRGEARVELIRMDDIYPGWGGLRAATEILLQHVIEPWRRGEVAGHPLWDWSNDTESGWRDIPERVSLIVEGCGAAAAWHDDPSTSLIWVEASDDTRKRRALERDGGTFDVHWGMWDAQWNDYVERMNPRRHARVVVRTDE